MPAEGEVSAGVGAHSGTAAASGPRGDRPVTYVFIGGYMHSGTTLLGEVIGNLVGTHRADGETKFLEFLPRYRELFPDLDDPRQRASFRARCRTLLTEGFRASLLQRSVDETTDADLRPDEGPVDHLGVYLAEVDALLRRVGARIFVEHTGTNVFGHRELAASGADVYLVDIVRDPRDVLASKKTRRATVFTDRYRPDEQRRKHFEKSFDPVWDTVSWRSFIRAGEVAASALPGRYLRIRYEDLVSDPTRDLVRVADLLGVDAPADLVVRTDNAADQATTRSGVDARSVGRWTTVLSPAEATACSWIARRELATLGYPSQAARPTAALAGPLVHAAVEPVVRVYRRFRLVGAAGASAIVRNYALRLRRSRPGG